MLRGDPHTQLELGTPDRRCWGCGHWQEDNFPAAGAQPLGWCQFVRWLAPSGHAQMTHADDVCAKFEAAHGHSPIEAEEWARAVGLG